MRVLVTRPLEDGQAIAGRLAALGHQALLAPLLTTRFFDGPEPDLADVQAILATSANGVRAFVRRSIRRDLPLFAVGPQTAEEARHAGFAEVRDADGDARALAAAVLRWTAPGKGTLLHAAGEDSTGNLAQNLAAGGFAVRPAVLYRVDAAAALPDAVRRALQDGALDAALFFSPRSARIFCDLAAGLPVDRLAAVAISPVTAAALTLDFAAIRVADKPNQDAMLAAL